MESTELIRRRGRRGLKVAAVVLGTVLLVGVPSAVALVLALNRGSGDELVRMVPANTDIYATALLDPSLAQKRDLQSVLERFPQLSSDSKLQKQLDSAMEDAFRSSGISWKNDVQPWIGSQIAGIGDFTGGATGGAMLLRTKDEHAAAAMFDKLKSGPAGKDTHFSSEKHGGVTVWRGSTASNSADGAYAVFDHTVVVGSSAAMVEKVIDTDQGKNPNLGNAATYKETLQDLPADHLGVVYVNAQSVMKALKDALGPVDSGSTPPFVQQALDQFNAYRSFGLALSLQSNAVDLDTVTLTDPAKLSIAARQALDKPAARSAMLKWIPSDSFVVLAGSSSSGASSALPLAALGGVVGLTVIGKQVNSTFTDVSSGLDQNAPSDSPPPPARQPDFNQALQQLGLTGPDGIEGHLTGESALFVGPSTGTAPVSAVAVIGTDDPARMETVLKNLGDLLTSGGQTAPWQDEQDGAVDIHYVDLSSTAGVVPAYAMVDGYAVVGTDPNAVRHAVEAHRGSESNVTAAPAFRSSAAGKAAGSVLFVDLQRTLQVIENTLSGSDRADFDQNVAPDLRPLRTLVVTSGGDDTHQTTRMELTLG